MSLDDARKLHVDMAERPDLVEALVGIEDDEERRQHVRSLGYEFTMDEWKQASREVEEATAGGLSDAQLETVTGGGASWVTSLSPRTRERLKDVKDPPPIIALYGVVVGE